MKAIALTGSIGSGKSSVLKIVRSFRVPTIDCDAIVSKMYREKAVQKKLKQLFGTVNRKEIAEIAFSSPKKRRQLERLLHPLVWKRVKDRLSSLENQGKPIAVADVPLLFEARWQNRFSAIVFVKAPKKTCLQRLAKRGLSRKEALQRWNAQISPRKKVKRSDYVIDNGGSLAKTRKQVRQLLQELAVK